jgi:hypothetical protein
MRVEKCVKEAGATYIRNQGDLFAAQAEIAQGFVKRMHYPLMGASGTEDRRPLCIE